MIAAEKKLPADERIDFVSVATPNHTHFEIAKAFAEAGFNVICDKPMTFDLAQAEELAKVVEKTGVVFARHAQLHRLSAGAAGPRDGPGRRTGRDQRRSAPSTSRAGCARGWKRATRSRRPGAPTRSKSGAAGCFGDIGTHAYNLGRYITGLLPEQISLPPEDLRARAARSTTTAPPSSASRTARSGTVTASQITPRPRERHLCIEIDGTKAALEWHQEEPNKMIVRKNGQPHQIYTRDRRRRTSAHAGRRACRLPSGHPGSVLRGVRQHLHAPPTTTWSQRAERREVRDGEHASTRTSPTAWTA